MQNLPIIFMKNLNLFLLIIIVSISSLLTTYGQNLNIRINQVGYYKNAPKIAVWVGSKQESFFLISQNQQDTVFRGKLSAQRVTLQIKTMLFKVEIFHHLEVPADIALKWINGNKNALRMIINALDNNMKDELAKINPGYHQFNSIDKVL